MKLARDYRVDWRSNSTVQYSTHYSPVTAVPEAETATLDSTFVSASRDPPSGRSSSLLSFLLFYRCVAADTQLSRSKAKQPFARLTASASCRSQWDGMPSASRWRPLLCFGPVSERGGPGGFGARCGRHFARAASSARRPAGGRRLLACSPH